MFRRATEGGQIALMQIRAEGVLLKEGQGENGR